jgi:hypothetical protein
MFKDALLKLLDVQSNVVLLNISCVQAFNSHPVKILNVQSRPVKYFMHSTDALYKFLRDQSRPVKYFLRSIVALLNFLEFKDDLINIPNVQRQILKVRSRAVKYFIRSVVALLKF